MKWGKIMNSYKIVYYFDNGFSVSQIIQSNSRENVYKTLINESIINFTDENDIYYIFKMSDVKLIKVISMKSEVQTTC